MKRTSILIAAAVLGTALVGGLALAHGFGRDGSSYMASRLADRLDLDPAQQTQVEAALEARQAAMQALREQIREERRRLADVVRDGSDPQVEFPPPPISTLRCWNAAPNFGLNRMSRIWPRTGSS